jgi:putative tryptophan/tyrosine transport system substrate-binding protein
MRRREFIAGLGGAAVWPLGALAQQGERVRRVGFLTSGSEINFYQKALRDQLEKLGWTEGRNLRLDLRSGNGDDPQTRALAADLVQLAPDVIVAAYLGALRALQQQTKTIPIVTVGGGDLLENGIVRNLSHPEGNVTGFPNVFGSLGGKWLELLKEVAPNITRVGSMHPTDQLGSYLQSMETAGQSLGVPVIGIPVSDAASVKAAIEAFAAEPNGGLIPSPAVFAIVPPVELNRLALQYRLPAVCGLPSPEGLLSHSFDVEEMLHGVGTYVDRLLRGAKVSDLPVQYPTKFRLTINLKTAKALGIEMPSSILVRADEVIE